MPKNITSVNWYMPYYRLPDGLDYDTETGKITGTPTETGEFEIPVSVSTNYGSDDETIKMIVKAGPPVAPNDIVIGIGTVSTVAIGETIYVPLSLFGVRNVTPSDEITIQQVTFSLNSPSSSTTTFYSNEFDNSYLYTSIDKETGNIVITRKKTGVAGSGNYARRHVRIKTNKGYCKGTISNAPNWFRAYITSAHTDLRVGVFKSESSSGTPTFSSATTVGTLTSSNYRSNYIY